MTARVRMMAFEYDESFSARWHPRLPEFACTANAVSLMMPYAEPYIVKSVRRAIPTLPPELQEEARAYAGQEIQHHRQHRRLNDYLIEEHPALRRVERSMSWAFARLNDKRSDSFNLAFAAGFETLAYTGARWAERQMGTLFEGSDSVAASLFLWHLAEEVEHKTVAYDVFYAAGGKRRTHLAGILVSTALLMFFALWSTLIMLWSQRQFFRPTAHFHLFTWSFGFAFDLLPALFVSLLPGHHPSDLADPPWLALWLSTYDPETGTIPAWNMPGGHGGIRVAETAV